MQKLLLDDTTTQTHIVLKGRKTALCGRSAPDPYDPTLYRSQALTEAEAIAQVREEATCKECKHALNERLLKELPVAERKRLRDTYAYMDSHGDALRIWAEGWRPIVVDDDIATTLRPGMRVLAKPELLGFTYGNEFVVTVHSVEPIFWNDVALPGEVVAVKVTHSTGVTECDEGDEVWVKEAER